MELARSIELLRVKGTRGGGKELCFRTGGTMETNLRSVRMEDITLLIVVELIRKFLKRIKLNSILISILPSISHWSLRMAEN